MRARSQSLHAATLGIALCGLATGCVELEEFDPVGDDAAIVATWLIDGTDPSVTTCAALGASRIRVTFLDDLRPVSHSGLFASCRLGVLDTREGSGAIVGAGTWTVRLDAIQGDGSLIAIGDSTVHTVADRGGDAGTSSIALSADFYSATLSTSYQVGGALPTTARCEAAGIATVGWVFEDLGGGAIVTPEDEPCVTGAIGVRLLPGHTYRFHVRALDAAGGVVTETSAQEFTPTAGCDQQLDATATDNCDSTLVSSPIEF